MEFVASETDARSDADTCLNCFGSSRDSLLAFETPTEAMIQCLGSEAAGLEEPLSEFPDLAPLVDSDEWAQQLMEPDFADTETSQGFSQDLLGLLEQLLAEALSGDDEDEELEEFEERGLFSLRGSGRTGR